MDITPRVIKAQFAVRRDESVLWVDPVCVNQHDGLGKLGGGSFVSVALMTTLGLVHETVAPKENDTPPDGMLILSSSSLSNSHRDPLLCPMKDQGHPSNSYEETSRDNPPVAKPAALESFLRRVLFSTTSLGLPSIFQALSLTLN